MRKRKTVKSESGRLSWDEYFMGIARAVGARGTCDRARLGCVIVKDKRIVSSGYIGAPAGCKHCDEVGHEMYTVISDEGVQSRHCVRTTHAEQNAIAQAARSGVSTDGATMYMLMAPCYACAKMIINAGIKRVVAENGYHAGQRSREIFKEANVKFEQLSKSIQTYSDM